MAGIGDKLLTASEIKEVTDTKVDNDFTKLSALPNGLADTDLFNVRRSETNYKLSALDLIPPPLVITIPTGQWIESNDDYYISVTASNVNENSILIPSYDHDSESVLKGPVWCVPDDGSFTIHTSAVPSQTVTIIVRIDRTRDNGATAFSGITPTPINSNSASAVRAKLNVPSTSEMNTAIAQSTADVIRTGDVSNYFSPDTTRCSFNDTLSFCKKSGNVVNLMIVFTPTATRGTFGTIPNGINPQGSVYAAGINNTDDVPQGTYFIGSGVFNAYGLTVGKMYIVNFVYLV